MLNGSQFVGQSNALAIHITTVMEMKPKNMAKVVCQIGKKEKDATLEVRQINKQELHKIKIKLGGDMDGGCEGKNIWDETIRILVL